MIKVIVNKVRCRHCNDVIESKYAHDFQRCQCGTIAVDGGTDYQRLSFKNSLEEDVDTSLSVYENNLQ